MGQTPPPLGKKLDPPLMSFGFHHIPKLSIGFNRGPHHAFYTGVKFAVLVQHPVVLF